MNLLSDKQKGLLPLLDQEASKSRKKAKPANFLTPLSQSNDPFFISENGNLFTIRHHGGDVKLIFILGKI